MYGDKYCSVVDAVAKVTRGSRIMVGSFGMAGYPGALIEALADSGVGGLTIISNDLGCPGVGLGRLLSNNQIRGLIGTYYNWNPEVATAYNEGKISVKLVPQGTFAEAIRAAGVGIPAFFTPTAAGTQLAEGKEMRRFDDQSCVLEEAIHADVALIKAYKADELGNLVYYKTARNFNPVMAMAADLVIAEVDEIVPTGSLDPECVITPHIYVDVLTMKGN